MADRYKIFLIYWFPVILYCALIFMQSSRPVPESLPRFPYLDKLLHVGAYAVLSGLFFRAYRITAPGKSLSAIVWLSVLSAGLYGVTDELHQHFVPFRSADVMDVAADLVGSGIGALAAAAVAGKSRVQRLTKPRAFYRKSDRS